MYVCESSNIVKFSQSFFFIKLFLFLSTGPNFIIKDLPTVLILILADQMTHRVALTNTTDVYVDS